MIRLSYLMMAILRYGVAKSKAGLDIPKKLTEHLFECFSTYFSQLDDANTDSNPAELTKAFGINGKNPDVTDKVVALRILFREFREGFQEGIDKTSTYISLDPLEREKRIKGGVNMKNWVTNNKLFRDEGYILSSSTKHKRLRRVDITNALIEILGMSEPNANKYYKECNLSQFLELPNSE